MVKFIFSLILLSSVAIETRADDREIEEQAYLTLAQHATLDLGDYFIRDLFRAYDPRRSIIRAQNWVTNFVLAGKIQEAQVLASLVERFRNNAAVPAYESNAKLIEELGYLIEILNVRLVHSNDDQRKIAKPILKLLESDLQKEKERQNIAAQKNKTEEDAQSKITKLQGLLSDSKREASALEIVAGQKLTVERESLLIKEESNKKDRRIKELESELESLKQTEKAAQLKARKAEVKASSLPISESADLATLEIERKKWAAEKKQLSDEIKNLKKSWWDKTKEWWSK